MKKQGANWVVLTKDTQTHKTKLGKDTLVGSYHFLVFVIRESGLIGNPIIKL